MDFGGPVVGIAGFISGWGAKILDAMHCSQKSFFNWKQMETYGSNCISNWWHNHTGKIIISSDFF